MICSVNEIETLAAKAARGAGAHAAQAAHFGRAVAYHLSANRPIPVLTSALAALPGGPIQSRPITAGAQTSLDTSYAEALSTPEHRPPLSVRLTCPDVFYEHLQSLAQNTYVPASVDSRVSGAGAGLTDND